MSSQDPLDLDAAWQTLELLPPAVRRRMLQEAWDAFRESREERAWSVLLAQLSSQLTEVALEVRALHESARLLDSQLLLKSGLFGLQTALDSLSEPDWPAAERHALELAAEAMRIRSQRP